MNCTESQDLLQRRLDGEPVAHPELAGHLADCANCRALHAAAGAFDRGLRLRKPILPPVGFSRSIVAAALAERRARQRRRLTFGVMAAAASMFLCVGLYLLSRSDDEGVRRHPLNAIYRLFWPEPPQAQIFIPTIILTPPVEQPPSLRNSVADAGTAVVALTKRTADETREQTKLLAEVLPMPLPTLEVGPPAPEPAVANVWQETGQRVSAGFEPVTSSARRAFSLFVRETSLPPAN